MARSAGTVPHSAEAETAVLAGILNHPTTAVALLGIAGPEAFWSPNIAAAMRAVADLAGEGVSPEPITVASRLDGDGFNLADLVGLVVDAPSDSGAAFSARIVATHATERAAMAAATALVEAAKKGRLFEVLPGIREQLAGLDAPDDLTADTLGKVDWPAFWSRDRSEADWLVDPFLVRGRSHAVYAPGKAGKSLFVLNVAVALATGRSTLHQPAGDPVSVTYLDYEMTEDDLQERLSAMGYDEATDLSGFHYYLLPALPPLDTAAGGRALERIIATDRPELVVVDTTARAVAGEENSADTIRDYYRHSGVILKRAGATSLRVDHSGKDLARGQRGSSAKNDDVDIVWQLTPADGGMTLRATHRRLGWVPETVDYRRREDPVLTFAPAPALWPAGTSEIAGLLDHHEVPIDASVRAAKTVLRDAGIGRRQDLVRAALKWRRARLEEQQWAS